MPSPLSALSPLDGRYAAALAPLAAKMSEWSLIRQRVRVELAWLEAIAGAGVIPGRRGFDAAARETFRDLVAGFSPADGERVKQIEHGINHDVKAVEYWLRERLAGVPGLAGALEFVHFACTSEDINNLAWALMLAEARAEVMLPALDELADALARMAHAHAADAMLARTHGQPATPTTLGKEFANVVARLRRVRRRIAGVVLTGKANGATGNYNAHRVACPEIDWETLARDFVAGLGLEFNPWTTQIEPHDTLAELLDAYAAANTVLLDLDRDLWGYVSLGYFRQRAAAGEVGSSTMPHKVNPIDFENAEGNFGIANALARHLADKLPVSRWQRDLSDSTALRNLGAVLGHSLLGYRSTLRGLGRLEADRDRLAEDLEANWEVLAEAVQQVMRRHGMPEAYEQLKALTRGRRLDRAALATFIDGLALPEDARARLAALTPALYTGFAAELARRI